MEWQNILNSDLEIAIDNNDDLLIYRSDDYDTSYGVFHFKNHNSSRMKHYSKETKEEIYKRVMELGDGEECFNLNYKNKKLTFLLSEKDKMITILLKPFHQVRDSQLKSFQSSPEPQKFHEDGQIQKDQSTSEIYERTYFRHESPILNQP